MLRFQISGSETRETPLIFCMQIACAFSCERVLFCAMSCKTAWLQLEQGFSLKALLPSS